MKKQTRNLLILGSVLVLLLGVYLILHFTLPDETETQAETFLICAADMDSLTDYSYTAEDASYTFRLENAVWLYTADRALPIDEGQMDIALDLLSDLSATVRMTDVESDRLATYGLRTDGNRLSYTDKNGTVTLLFGSQNVYNSMIYVARADDLSTVYMISTSVESYLRPALTEFVSTAVLPTVSAQNLISLEVKKDGRTLLFTYHADGNPKGEISYSNKYIWTLSVDGGQALPVDTTIAGRITSSLTSSLTCTGCAAVTDVSNPETYGIVNGAALTLHYRETVSSTDENGAVLNQEQEKSLSFLLGVGADDAAYIKPDGQNAIFALSGTLWTTLALADQTHYRPTALLAVNTSYLTSVFWEDGEHSLRLDIDPTATTNAYSVNGEPIDYQTVEPLYTALTTMQTVGVPSEQEPDESRRETPTLSVILTFTDDVRVTELTILFTPYNTDAAAVTFSNGETYLVATADVAALCALLQAQ